MTYIICCSKCGKSPDKVLDQHNYIPNHGVFHCNHVMVFEKQTYSTWRVKRNLVKKAQQKQDSVK